MENQKEGRRKIRQGIVVSNKMQDTVVVKVDRTMRHPKYGKVVTRSKKYYAHAPAKSYEPGQEVTIVESRPISKLKRWRVVEEKTVAQA